MEAFAASLLGAVVGGLLALFGVLVAHQLELRRQQKAERSVVRAFLQAILSELEACKERGDVTIKPAIAAHQEGEPFATETFIETDFFTVYHNNSDMLGRVDNDELRTKIVRTYVRNKALVETINVNTRYWLKWKETNDRYYYDASRGWFSAIRRDTSCLRKTQQSSYQP